jgi:hypothetical protein
MSGALGVVLYRWNKCQKKPSTQDGLILVSPLKLKQVIGIPTVAISSRLQFNAHSTCT